jgi:uncharacterized RDD family membrane protein YckC
MFLAKRLALAPFAWIGLKAVLALRAMSHQFIGDAEDAQVVVIRGTPDCQSSRLTDVASMQLAISAQPALSDPGRWSSMARLPMRGCQMVASWNAGQDGGVATPSMSDPIETLLPQSGWPQSGPQPGALPGQQNLLGQAADIMPGGLGRRVAAAMIDLVLLTGLLFTLSLIVGQRSAAMALLYLALPPCYYFALEATVGRTVGKLVLGLRILRADGGRPSTGAIFERTLLRLVDGFPAFYLTGFITMLVTGPQRRQRLGDLAAGTIVVRARPIRFRGLVVASLALVLLATAGLSTYRAVSAPTSPIYAAAPVGPTQTYRAHGISFKYPAGWHQETIPASAVGAFRWASAFGSGSEGDTVIAAAARLKISVSAGDMGAVSSHFTPPVRRIYQQEGGVLQVGPQQITMGGLPGILFQGTVTLPDGTPVEATRIYVFEGTTEYYFNCQSTLPATQQVQAACGELIHTFEPRSAPRRSSGRSV